MTRTRITTTNDASSPKTVWLGSGIKWYAYIRPPNQTLCIQRSVGGVRDPEIAITTPVPNFDVILDPAVPNTGWIYFVHDGATEKLQVTPLGAALNSIAYLRQDGWYQSVPAVHGGTQLLQQWTTTEFPPVKFARTDNILDGVKGLGGTQLLYTWATSEGPDPPTIALERTTIDLHLVITAMPNLATFRNRNITQLKIYRKENEVTGYLLYSTFTLPPQPHTWEPPNPALKFLIPFTGSPITYWYATCVRTGYLASESAPSNVVFDDGNLPIIYLELPLSGGGTGLEQSFTTTEYTIDKRLVTDPPTDTVGEQVGFGGTSLLRQWTVNGNNILNP